MMVLPIGVLLLSFLFMGSVQAQAQEAAQMNMEILKEKIKADKKLVVAANMSLNDAEAKNFWPLYDGYQKELEQINQRLGATIKGYAAHTMPAKASSPTTRPKNCSAKRWGLRNRK